VACLSQHAPYEELLASPLYRDWAKPQGIIDTAQTTLQKSGTALAVLAINRHESIGLVDEPMMRKIGMLSPHFRRAVLIGKAIDLHKVEAATLADTLDGLAAGMILVDAQGRILHTNAQGRVLLELGDVVRNTKGMLRAIDPAADTSLQAVFAAAAGGDAAVGVTGIAVPLTSGASERWVAHVLPLTSGARRKASASYSAVAAVFVRKTALDLLSPIQTMTQAYQLTPAEGRVLMAVAAIGGVADVASAIGISEATVKTHLQHLFEKTGTNRQADLIKLIAGFMGPLV
jgi:DNA-binding CsgD family transcriptional regulator